MMVSIKFENQEAVIRFPEKLISEDYVQAFIEQLHIEEIARKSQLTDEQVWEMTEQIQQEWWEKNKQKFTDKIEKGRR
jgi:ribosomal protein S13